MYSTKSELESQLWTLSDIDVIIVLSLVISVPSSGHGNRGEHGEAVGLGQFFMLFCSILLELN